MCPLIGHVPRKLAVKVRREPSTDKRPSVACSRSSERERLDSSRGHASSRRTQRPPRKAVSVASISQNWDNRVGATCPGRRRETAALGRVLQARFLELSRGGQGGHGQRSRHRPVWRNGADSEAVEGARSWRAGNRRVARWQRVSGLCTRSGSRRRCTSSMRSRRSLRLASGPPNETSTSLPSD